jgi:hypothetical protein
MSVYNFLNKSKHKRLKVKVKEKFLIFILLFSLTSCDDFLLKKTVEVTYLSGEVFFNPFSGTIEGNATYNIVNPQETELNEIYIINHPSVFVKTIKIKKLSLFFDVNRLYGYNVYRVRISPLKSNEATEISLSFFIKSPVNDERFVFNDDFVFFDARKVWIPIPFMSSTKFKYTFQVKVPKEYYAVIGSKLVSEQTDENYRIQKFESEFEDVLKTGTLIIAKFFRFAKNNIYYYTFEKENIEEIFNSVGLITDYFRKNFNELPFTQLHIVNQLFQYEDLILSIDAESFANLIMIPNLDKIKFNTYTGYNYIYDNSGIKFLKTLAHEMSHLYFIDRMNFENTAYIHSEALMDYLSLLILRDISYINYENFLLKNRFELQNLKLSGNIEKPLYKFLYLENFLDSLFSKNKRNYLLFLDILTKKYPFTRISPEDIKFTLEEMPLEFEKLNISTYFPKDAVSFLESGNFYNSFLSWTTRVITNKVSKKKVNIKKYKLVSVNHNFPFTPKFLFIEEYKNSTITNIVFIPTKETNFLLSNDIVSVKLSSHFDMFEENLYDNFIKFSGKSFNEILEEVLNFYYSGQMLDIPKNFSFEKLENYPVDIERSFEKDRELSWELKGRVRFVVDVIKEYNEGLYIMAYKLVNNKPFSYVLINGRKVQDKIILTSIIDPLL